MNLNKFLLLVLLIFLSVNVNAETIFWQWDDAKKYPYDDGYKFSLRVAGSEMRSDPLFLKEREAFKNAYPELCDSGLLKENVAGAVAGLIGALFVEGSDVKAYGVTADECYFPKPNWRENKAKFEDKTKN